MFYIFITLIIVSIVLFIGSYYISDKIDQLEEQFEQFSISSMQDTYQMKKKIKILEEELLTEDFSVNSKQKISEDKKISSMLANKPLLIQRIYHLNDDGLTMDEIATQTGLKVHDVKTILNHKS